jgi:hypothetical protein
MITRDTVEHRFDLNGTIMAIAAPDAALITPLLGYLGELSTAQVPGTVDFQVTIARGAPQAAPGDARLLFDGPLPEGTPCRISMDGDWRWALVPDRLSLHYSTSRRQAHMQVAPGAEALVGGSVGILLLDAALIASQQIMIHAAALRLPQRQGAICLLAPRGVGQTTPSLALALQGIGLMTDDATVLTPAGDAPGLAPSVWGLPRPLKVHKRTAELLPQIGRLLRGTWNAEGEQSLARSTLHSVIVVPPPRPAPLAAFVVLGQRVEGDHCLRPISKADLLVRFAGDNIFRSRHGVQDADLARYLAIARTVTALPALELNVGSRLDLLSECILAVLG